MPHSDAHEGFSLVEVVVIITILGIVAAFAIPRFASLEVEARSAETTALAGSMRTNAALAHAMWLGENQPAAVTMGGTTIRIENGYPDVQSIAETLAKFDGFVFEGTGSTALFLKTDDAAEPIPGCSVSYEAPEARGAAPAVAVDVTGC